MAGATTVSPLRLAGTAVYLAVWPTAIFVLAGDSRWLEGWLYSSWFVGLCGTVIVYLYLKDPALLAERYRRPGSGGQSGWDRAWVYGIAVGFFGWIAVMPIDARRFHWSPPFALGVKAGGGALLLASSFFLFRAFHDNTFLSPLVRIQSEREQRVVSSGVYGFVRHPMYLGAASCSPGLPFCSIGGRPRDRGRAHAPLGGPHRRRGAAPPRTAGWLRRVQGEGALVSAVRLVSALG